MREADGLAGWLLDRVRGLRQRAGTEAKELQLLEVLSLGGRRQLMLVACGTQQYLVGCGAESVETIVSVSGVSGTRERGDYR